jgi:hypothetical protein
MHEERNGKETQHVYLALNTIDLCLHVLYGGFELQDPAIDDGDFPSLSSRIRSYELDDPPLQNTTQPKHQPRVKHFMEEKDHLIIDYHNPPIPLQIPQKYSHIHLT